MKSLCHSKTGAELETGTDLTVHWILKYCITKFSLIRGCFNRHDDHKYSQDQHCLQNGHRCTTEQVNYGQDEKKREKTEEKPEPASRRRRRRPQLSTGERRNRWEGHWAPATHAKHDTPAHANKKSKHLNAKIIALIWKNILQLFQLHRFHSQLPLQKHVTVGAGKIMRN